MPDVPPEARSLRRYFLIAAAVIVALALIYLLTQVPRVEDAAPTTPPGDTG